MAILGLPGIEFNDCVLSCLGGTCGGRGVAVVECGYEGVVVRDLAERVRDEV